MQPDTAAAFQSGGFFYACKQRLRIYENYMIMITHHCVKDHG
jgi:hypothetical protein